MVEKAPKKKRGLKPLKPLNPSDPPVVLTFGPPSSIIDEVSEVLTAATTE
jgi:hypothetical protein